ncbi:STAS domain-containing protein [Streptomyces sp. NPDC101118]|uniref:STAS domain-containing protein n=1 Tax=Streptomyces sp. NPDC101118 TaxID=3366109 RepID=UPI00381C013C
MQDTFDVHVTETPERTVVVVAGELDLSTSAHVTQATDALVLTGRTLSVDLAAVPFIDSSGLNMLLTLRRRAEQEHAGLELRGLGRQALRLLDLTGSRDLFHLS